MYYLLKLLKKENIKILQAYFEAPTNDVVSPQTKFINETKSQYDNGSIDLAMFFNRLTFADNSYAIKDMDNYSINDESDFIGDDGDYDSGTSTAGSAEGANGNEQVTDDRDSTINNLRSAVDDEMCIVCFGSKKNTLVEPCLHLKFCYDCIDKIYKRAPTSEIPTLQKNH